MNFNVMMQQRRPPLFSMPTSAAKKKTAKSREDEQAVGMWVDTALISRLFGRRSPLSELTVDAESERLLHYADVMLGTDKKEAFISSKPTKDRKK
jgi:hypothetical protein